MPKTRAKKKRERNQYPLGEYRVVVVVVASLFSDRFPFPGRGGQRERV